jgi:hypothetical protein
MKTRVCYAIPLLFDKKSKILNLTDIPPLNLDPAYLSSLAILPFALSAPATWFSLQPVMTLLTISLCT